MASGKISKKQVRGWLENYQALIAEDRSIDDMPRNSGQKPQDGVNDAMLNRIMLTQALDHMQKEAWVLYACCKARWIDQDRLGPTLRRLGLTTDKYYRRCEWAVDYVYFYVNGLGEKRRKRVDKVVRLEL